MRVDLHTHTRYSDGTTTPSENCELAAAEGVDGLALTDHDTVDGWGEASAGCERRGLLFVPGVELSTELGGASVHLLGYWVDPEDRSLAAECDRLRNERARRADAIVERLVSAGVEVSIEAVRRRAGGAPIGRPHIAAVMVESGVVPDVRSAFDAYLGDGKPAHVPKHAVDPLEGLRLIRNAGGVAVLAHPGLTLLRDLPGALGAASLPAEMVALVDRLAAAGLAGIEADHSAHDEATAAAWRAVARDRELLVTGSSDFHGENKDVRIGASTTPGDVVEALAELAGARITG